MQSVRHLSDVEIEQLVEPAAAAHAVWSAFEAWGHGTAATTQRVRASAGIGMASAMAAVVPPFRGGKLYATTDGRFTFVIVLFDVDGRPLATLDGGAITNLRTPAASSLAIHHLAARHATIATVIGTGNQAWPHVQMLSAALPGLADLRICGRPGSGAADALTARARAAGFPARAVDDAIAATAGAQVIVTVTSAHAPLFPSDAVSDDALVCAVGATKHDRVEIDPELVARCATVVCDDVVGSRTECGDLIHAADTGHFGWDRAVELHAVAAGSVDVPRAGPAPVLFESQGVAIQDVAVAGLAYELATAGPVTTQTLEEVNR